MVARNGFELTEAATLRRCFNRAWPFASRINGHAAGGSPEVTGFLSVNANNHLALRVPAWTDDGYRDEADIAFDPARGPPTEQHVAPRVSARVIGSLQTDPVSQPVAYLGGMPGINASRLACLRRCCS